MQLSPAEYKSELPSTERAVDDPKIVDPYLRLGTQEVAGSSPASSTPPGPQESSRSPTYGHGLM